MEITFISCNLGDLRAAILLRNLLVSCALHQDAAMLLLPLAKQNLFVQWPLVFMRLKCTET